MLEDQEGAGRKILKELKLPDIGRPNTSWGGYSYCDIPLCKMSSCWVK